MSDKQNVLTVEQQEQMEELIKKGERAIFPERADQWASYVNDCFYGQYKGKDAAEALAIIEALNKGVEIEEAKKMLTEIEPNGEANGPIRRAILLFANNGPEFWKKTSKGHISLRTRWQLFKIGRANRKIMDLYKNALVSGNEPEVDESEKNNEPTNILALDVNEIEIINVVKQG